MINNNFTPRHNGVSKSANELKMAEMVIEENQEIIIQQWHTFFGK